MGWVCKFCSTNNEDYDVKCMVCDKPKGASIPSKLVSTSRPVTSTSRPTTSTTRPATSTSRPTTSTTRPATSTSRPTTSTTRPATSKSTTYIYSPSLDVKEDHKAAWTPVRVFSSILLIALACAIVIPILLWLTSMYGWIAWQCVIGIVSVFSVILTVIILSKLLEDRFEVYPIAITVTALTMLVNLILLDIFEVHYLIISSIIYACGTVGSGIMAYKSFGADASTCGKIDIGLSVYNVLALVLSLMVVK